MERNETSTICRLCLSENDYLIHVFEAKGLQGWTAAIGITELLQIQVSADDIYPQCVCVECMGKLKDFKIFKERCESCKELLDRAYAAKLGIGRNEEFFEGTLNFTEDHGDPYLKEEDPNITLEKDPLELTEEDKPIKSEIENCIYNPHEVDTNEELESMNDPSIPDKNEGKDSLMTLKTEVETTPSSLSLTALDSKDTIPLQEPNGQYRNILEVSDAWRIKEEVVDTTVEVDSHELLKEEELIISENQSSNVFSDEMALSEEGRWTGSHCLINRNETCNSDSGWEICPNTKSPSSSLGGSSTSDNISMAGNVNTSIKQENDNILVANKSCCKPGSSKLDITTSGFPSTSKGLIASSSDCCPTYSSLDYLQQPRRRAHRISLPVFPASLSKPENVCSEIKDSVSHNGPNQSTYFPTGNNDPLQLPLMALRNEKEEHGMRVTLISSGQKSKEVYSEKMESTEEDISSYLQHDSNKKHNSSSNVKAPGPCRHERRTEVNDIGDNLKGGGCQEAEESERGSLERALEGNESNSCGISINVEGKLRNCAQSQLAGEIFKSKVNLAKEVVGGNLLVGTNESIDGKCMSLNLNMFMQDFECELCKKKFKHRGNFNAHLRVHKGLKPFKCGECNKVFGRKSHLKAHSITHSGEKPFKCGECNEAFTQRGSLRRHLRLHTGEKPYICTVCGLRFKQSVTLQCHLAVHKGLKPFKCEQCNMRFSEKSHLQNHLRLHNGDKPYKCRDCEMSFNQLSALKCHVRVHLGEKRFICTVCNLGFNTKRNLGVHFRHHSGDKPYKCTICGTGYKIKDNLQIHIKTHELPKTT